MDVPTSKTSKGVIDKLKPHLATSGLPDRITADNGPQFDCREFQQFAEQYQFEHIRTSPQNPGLMARQRIVLKQQSKLDIRNTPSEGMKAPLHSVSFHAEPELPHP